jgi:hypothetical protein
MNIVSSWAWKGVAAAEKALIQKDAALQTSSIPLQHSVRVILNTMKRVLVKQHSPAGRPASTAEKAYQFFHHKPPLIKSIYLV